jgi:NAD(P)-dependent dehydrogenase (short-subunit alcohol dehydrogenase family)
VIPIRGRAVLLTGASGGIGRATVRVLARERARLALHGRREEALREAEAEARGLGAEALVVTGDIRSDADAARAVAAATGRFGALDVLVNNAGVGALRRMEERVDSEFSEQLEVNVLGAWRMTRAAVPALSARRGHVVNVASMSGRIGATHYSFYGATKFALIGMSESWRRELRPRGIRVTTLVPAAVSGSFLDRLDRGLALGAGPAGVVLRPEEVADAIARVLRRPCPDLYLPWWNRWLAAIDVALPGISDRIVSGLYRDSRRPA